MGCNVNIVYGNWVVQICTYTVQYCDKEIFIKLSPTYMQVKTVVKGTTLFAVVGLKRKINVKFLLASLETLNSYKK